MLMTFRDRAQCIRFYFLSRKSFFFYSCMFHFVLLFNLICLGMANFAYKWIFIILRLVLLLLRKMLLRIHFCLFSDDKKKTSEKFPPKQLTIKCTYYVILRFQIPFRIPQTLTQRVYSAGCLNWFVTRNTLKVCMLKYILIANLWFNSLIRWLFDLIRSKKDRIFSFSLDITRLNFSI